jgi:hypothetical protein
MSTFRPQQQKGDGSKPVPLGCGSPLKYSSTGRIDPVIAASLPALTALAARGSAAFPFPAGLHGLALIGHGAESAFSVNPCHGQPWQGRHFR